MSEPQTAAGSPVQEAVQAFEAAHQAIVGFVTDCSETDWHRVVPIEERTVAVMADHIAMGYELSVGWLRSALAGQPIPGEVGQMDVDNARDALERSGVSRAEVLELLQARSPAVLAALRSVRVEYLERRVHFGPGNMPMPVSSLVTVATSHVTRHLEHIRAALEE